MRNQSTRFLFLFASLAALLLGMSGIGVPFAQGHARLASPQQVASQTCGAWNVVTSPNPSGLNVLNGTAAVSTNDVWAVGYDNGTGGSDQTLTEHWNGTSWSVVASPNVGSNTDNLQSVAAVSTNDVWAVGNNEISPSLIQTLTEHWNGTRWSVVASPNVSSSQNEFYGVAAVSANDAWAVGYDFNSSVKTNQALIEHWNGTRWSVVASPNGLSDSVLYGVAAVSVSDVWAVGYDFNSSVKTIQTLTLHWNGTRWSVVASPNPSSETSTFYGLAAVSASDVWAVGSYFNTPSLSQTLTEHWNGTRWSVVASPNVSSSQNEFYGVAAVSANDAWAVGYDFNSSVKTIQTLIEHWNGTSWSVVASPNVSSNINYLYGVAAVSNDVWTVGFYGYPYFRTLIEFYC